MRTSARDVPDTDWSQVVALYDHPAGIDHSPIVALGRAVALADLDGPEVALTVIDRLDLGRYHATHADLLRRLGRSANARAAYEKAIELASNAAEVPYLTRRGNQPAPNCDCVDELAGRGGRIPSTLRIVTRSGLIPEGAGRTWWSRSG